MKRLSCVSVALTALIACGCASSRITQLPYNAVSVWVESEIQNDDHLSVCVGSVETDMPTQSAFELLSRLYSAHADDPPPMILRLNTKLATFSKQGPCFLDTMKQFSSIHGFDLYIQRLPVSSQPPVDEALNQLWEAMSTSNKTNGH
jgi:hypothetical protein